MPDCRVPGPVKRGCMKQVHAEGEQGLCFPSGEGSVGRPENILLNKTHVTYLLSGALLELAIEPLQYSNPSVGSVGNTWVLSVTYIQDYSDYAFKVRI